MCQIRHLSQTVISPNDDILDILHSFFQLFCDLCNRSILIQSGQSGEILLWNISGIEGSDQCICVGRVSDHCDFTVGFCEIGDGFSLGFEDSAVCAEEILAFHTRAAGTSANKQSVLAT
jgi:hypothetical protein